MAGVLPQQQGYMPANSATSGQYVGGPGQPQAPAAMGHPGTAGHPQGPAAPGQVIASPAQGQMHHQPGPNEASLAELISFD